MNNDNATLMLSDGLLTLYEPGLKKIEKQLSELTTKQIGILKEVELENKKLSDLKIDAVINQSLFVLVRDYQMRLMNVKKEMGLLTERSARLKKRALKLQEFKQREALENAHYRESQLKREQDLIAKPNPNFSHIS